LSFRAAAAYRSGKTPNNAAQSLSPHVGKLASAGNANRLANDPEIIAQVSLQVSLRVRGRQLDRRLERRLQPCGRYAGA
jgi:hypothetical protein